MNARQAIMIKTKKTALKESFPSEEEAINRPIISCATPTEKDDNAN